MCMIKRETRLTLPYSLDGFEMTTYRGIRDPNLRGWAGIMTAIIKLWRYPCHPTIQIISNLLLSNFLTYIV
jgi:hypothetical protein